MQEPQDRLEGHFQPPPDSIKHFPHHAGFDLAIEDALRQADKSWHGVQITVEFGAYITENPGNVGDYIAFLTKTGG